MHTYIHNVYMHIHIYIYIYTCMYVYIYIYIHIFQAELSFQKLRSAKEGEMQAAGQALYCSIVKYVIVLVYDIIVHCSTL